MSILNEYTLIFFIFIYINNIDDFIAFQFTNKAI